MRSNTNAQVARFYFRVTSTTLWKARTEKKMSVKSTCIGWCVLLLMDITIYCNADDMTYDSTELGPNFPAAPENVKAVQVGKSDVLVTWEMPESRRIQHLMHRVFYAPVEDGDQWKSLNTSGSTSAIIGGLSQDEIYLIRVSSVSPLGQGPMSAPVMVTIQFVDDCLQCKSEGEISFYCNCSSKILQETCVDVCRFRCKNTPWFEPVDGCPDGCITGWYGQYCNMSCPGMCLECEKLTGKCVTCMSQWTGPYCNKTCPPGLYGENCSMSCSTHCNRCLNQSYCNECKSGRYGESCQGLCHPNCLTCIDEPQKCTSCILGKFLEIGSVCLDCPENCMSCSERDKCVECKTGKYGPKCEFKCPPNCVTCTSSDQCNKCVPLRHGNKCHCNSKCRNVEEQCDTGEVCQNGCPPLKMGVYCNHSCPQNCYKCDQLTGLCLTCVSGFYGPNCNQTCGQCKRNSKGETRCNRHTGKCEECMSGWHGWRCNESCSTLCRTSYCDKFTGKCDSCVTGFYGPRCKEECNKNCYNVTMTGCDQQTGLCELCASGFYGYSCNETCLNYCGIYPCDKESGICEKCPNGLYGEKCNKRCNPRCHASNSTNDLCDRESGYCIQGCHPGWYNEFCQSPCSATCMDNLCKQDTGLCLLGCVNGFTGDTCSQNVHGEYLLSLDVRQIGAKSVLIQWDKLNLTDTELESVKRVVLNHKIPSSTTVNVIDVTDYKTRNHFLLQDVDVNDKHTFQLVVLFELRSKSPIISKPVEFVLEPRASSDSILHLTTDVEIYDISEQLVQANTYSRRYETRTQTECTRVSVETFINTRRYDNIAIHKTKCTVTGKGEIMDPCVDNGPFLMTTFDSTYTRRQ